MTIKEKIDAAKKSLSSGEYKECIRLLEEFKSSYKISTNYGLEIRYILATAYMGLDLNTEAIQICKELSKSNNLKVREEIKNFLEILNAPKLETPENWKIKIQNPVESEIYYKEINNKIRNEDNNYAIKEKIPTGKTIAFKNGFIFSFIIIFFSLIFILEGCSSISTKVILNKDNTIKQDWEIKSNSKTILPWQKELEKRLKNNFRDIKLSHNELGEYYINTNSLSPKDSINMLDKIIEEGNKLSDIDLINSKINLTDKNFFLINKSNIYAEIDLTNFPEIEDLKFNISFSPVKRFKLISYTPERILINKSDLLFRLKEGALNKLELSYWDLNLINIVAVLVIFCTIILLIIRRRIYAKGYGLPELPP
tara:strand:- start:232 stop:1335 length:1104 start_codon:yes stop_codon:yes gene_type:complete